MEARAAGAQGFSDALLAAARAENGAEVGRLIDSSFAPPAAKFSASAATAMLDDLVRRREWTAFTVLHDHGAKPDTVKAPSRAPHKGRVNEGHVSMADGTPLGPDLIASEKACEKRV